MRLATASLVLLLLSTSARAQTLPPEAFYPLDLGNEWVYTFQFSGPRFLQHDRIVGTETVGGAAYTQRERCEVPVNDDGPGVPDCELQLIRFADRDLVVRQPDGSEVAEACAVGAPAGTETACDDVVGPDFTLVVLQSGPTTVVVGQHTVDVAGVQDYGTTQCCIDPPPAGFAQGLGRLVSAFGDDVARFEYARVGDREVGVNPLDPDPASFDPVAVGTVREFADPVNGAGGYPTRVDDVRTVVLDGETWTVRRTQQRSLTPDPTFGTYTRTETRALVRYDAASANVLVRQPDGSAQPLYPCSLDRPEGQSECGGLTATLALDQTVEVGGDAVGGDARVRELWAGPATRLRPGPGASRRRGRARHRGLVHRRGPAPDGRPTPARHAVRRGVPDRDRPDAGAPLLPVECRR